MRIACFGRGFLGPVVSSRCSLRRMFRVLAASGWRLRVPYYLSGDWKSLGFPRGFVCCFDGVGAARFLVAFWDAPPP